MQAAELTLREPLYESVSFNDWLEGRRPQHLSTNAGMAEIAFQSWRNFKEAFAPELIGQAVRQTQEALGRPVVSCVDPFGGSGSPAVWPPFGSALQQSRTKIVAG